MVSVTPLQVTAVVEKGREGTFVERKGDSVYTKVRKPQKAGLR